MQIFKTLASSVYGPDFYKKIKDRNFGQAFGYSFFIILLAFLMGSLILGVQFAKEVSFRPAQIEEAMHELYPDELQLNFENGILTANVNEPYLIETGENLDFLETEAMSTLAVIDTTTPFSAEQFYNYNTFAWFGLDSLHIMDDNSIQTLAYPEEALMIDEEKVRQIATKVSGFILPAFIALLLLGGIFGVFFITLGRLFINLFFALIVMLAAKAKKLNWDYGTSYIASLHVFTLATLLAPIQFLLPNDVQIPFLRLGLFVFVLAMNLYKMDGKK